MFGKKKKEQESEEQDDGTVQEEKKSESADTGNPKLDIELTKIKAQLESFGEIRKANSERFSRIGEQVGELRGMIMDTNKAVGGIEVKATKSSDLVSSVQPEKLMIAVRKSEGKVEALHANIESNETMMKNIMEELKKMRHQMNVFRGIDQIVKLADDIKKEVLNMQRIEGTVDRHADKVETIFIEFNKRFSDFDKFNDSLKDLNKSFQRIQNDFDKMKVTANEKSDKKEVVSLVNKFNDFEKHTTNILKLIDKKAKRTDKELDDKFDQLQEQLSDKFDVKFNIKKREKKNLLSKMIDKLKGKKEEGEEEQSGAKEVTDDQKEKEESVDIVNKSLDENKEEPAQETKEENQEGKNSEGQENQAEKPEDKKE
ncbi:hypothetical protein GOV04_03325 [Candidatus Woesearchaeota archaeon]|nr:hypothetical protein [Candidatus Woesearchaeota archaeon]